MGRYHPSREAAGLPYGAKAYLLRPRLELDRPELREELLLDEDLTLGWLEPRDGALRTDRPVELGLERTWGLRSEFGELRTVRSGDDDERTLRSGAALRGGGV